MAKISSNWRLRFDPIGVNITLLAFNDLIEGELRFPLKRGLEVVPLIDAAAPFLRPTGNAVVQISFTVYTDESLDTTARQRVMESLIALGPLTRKPLRVEVAGITDRYWQFANCMVGEYETGREEHGHKARLVKTYNITATGLTQVGP